MAEGGHDEFEELMYAEDEYGTDYADRSDRTLPATMETSILKYPLCDKAALEAAVELVNLNRFYGPKPTVNLVNNTANLINDLTEVSHNVSGKELGKKKSHGHFESDPTEDQVRGPRSTPVAPMELPEAQRLISLIARQKQIIERQNMLLKKLADGQREQDAILDSPDSSPVARIRRSEPSNGALATPDRAARRLSLDHRTSRTGRTACPQDSFRTSRTGRTACPQDSFRTSRTAYSPDSLSDGQLGQLAAPTHSKRLTRRSDPTARSNHRFNDNNRTSSEEDEELMDDDDDDDVVNTTRADPPRGAYRSATAKLGSFDGTTTSLETHLSRFETHSRFFKWSEEERLFHLFSSLIKDAGNILWDGSACGSSLALI